MKTLLFFSEMNRIRFFFPAIIFIASLQLLHAQQPNVPIIAKPPQGKTTLYQLNIIPVKGGKTHTIISKTKVVVTFKNGSQVTGKVKGVSIDSLNIDYRNYAISGIEELKYNPGTALGAAAAIVTAVGVGAIALTADGGKDNSRDNTENAIFYTGIAMAVAGGVTLIPTYFVKERFSIHEYDFVAVPYGTK